MDEKETRLKVRFVLRHADKVEWDALEKETKEEKLKKIKSEETPYLNKE